MEANELETQSPKVLPIVVNIKTEESNKNPLELDSSYIHKSKKKEFDSSADGSACPSGPLVCLF